MKSDSSPFPHDGSYGPGRASDDVLVAQLRRAIAVLRLRQNTLAAALGAVSAAFFVLMLILQPQWTIAVMLLVALVVLIAGGAMHAVYRGDRDVGVE